MRYKISISTNMFDHRLETYYTTTFATLIKAKILK